MRQAQISSGWPAGVQIWKKADHGRLLDRMISDLFNIQSANRPTSFFKLRSGRPLAIYMGATEKQPHIYYFGDTNLRYLERTDIASAICNGLYVDSKLYLFHCEQMT